MAEPSRKKPRLEEADGTSASNGNYEASNSKMAAAASKTRVVLALCGSFSPITNMHLRMFGKQLASLLNPDPLLTVALYLSRISSRLSAENRKVHS